MGWTPRQLMLPVLIGISLTGVGLGIIYLLVEWDKENEKRDKGARGMRSTGFLHLEITVPREMVPVVIGRGGSMIKSIENTTGTKIEFDVDNPEERNRTCHVRGNAEGLRMAEAMIQNTLTCQPRIEMYEMHVPQRVCPVLIGRVGETINRIQSSSGAKVIVEKSWSHDPNFKSRVIIKGTTEQIANALSQIEDKLHEYEETLEKLVASESSRSSRGKVSPRIAAVNPSADTPLLTQPLDSQTLSDNTMEVYVSAVESPSQFWVQVAGSGTLCLDELVAEMTAYYENPDNRELHVLKSITVGQTVAAKFLFDGKWYRAEVTSALENDEYVVYFLDYGDHEVVSIDHVLELRTDFLSLRLQAIECALANVKPRDDDWTPEAIERFSDLTWVAQWKVLIAKVRGYKERVLGHGRSRREGSPIPCVDLYDKNDNQDINIGKQMVAENFAEAEEGAWSAASSTLSLSRRSNAASPSPVRSPPPPVKWSPLPILTPSPKKIATATVIRKGESPEIVEEVDLATPPPSTRSVIEEVDLVTPVREKTRILAKHDPKFPFALMEQIPVVVKENGNSASTTSNCYEIGDYERPDI